MSSVDAWSQIADSPFVSLGTYRKTGELVATPVWIARDGDDLVVTTNRETGKVKRLRRDPRVTLRPCTRTGEVADNAVTVTGAARLDDGLAAGNRALGAKYGMQYKVVTGFGGLVRRLTRKPNQSVIIRISKAPVD